MTSEPVQRPCEHCGTPFPTRRSDARYCGARCRARAKYRRDRGPVAPRLRVVADDEPVPGDVPPGPIESAVVALLSAAGAQGHPVAAQAVATARRQDRATNDTGASFAALGRELRECLAIALAKPEDGQTGGKVAQFRARRAARLRAAYDELVAAGDLVSVPFDEWVRGR